MGARHTHALFVHAHSPVHRLAPEVKVAAAFGLVFCVAVTPRESLWAFAVYGLVLSVILKIARLPLRFVLGRLLVVLPFIAFAFLIPFVATGERVEVLGLALSREGLWGAWNVLAKASLGATVSIILAGTTEVSRILQGMDRLRVPATFTAIAGFMVRYLEVVAGDLRRMRTAMTARGYDPRWLWQARPIATSAGTLFIRSYERGERIHAAMLSRGYTGSMPVTDRKRPARHEWCWAAAVVLCFALVSALSFVVAR